VSTLCSEKLAQAFTTVYATKNFNDLPNEAKAALQRAGIVYKSGKIK